MTPPSPPATEGVAASAAVAAAPPAPPRRGRLRWLGAAASAGLLLASLAVLVVIARELDAAAVRAAFAAASGERLGLAAGFTALSYALLTGYDWLGLKHLKAAVPYATAAFAAFTSYAVSFTLGFPLVTAGTVRYWVYAPKGLAARDIAGLTLVAAVTFWLGMGVVLGLGLVLRPVPLAEVARLPVALTGALGWGLLAAIGLYLIWAGARPRAVRVRGWRLPLPGLRSNLAQLLLGLADACAAAAVLYVLVPPDYRPAFETFVAIYVVAALLGIASHAPGGLGVFEATMLVALPNVPREELLGALLLYRLVYYLGPFVIALALLVGREIRLRGAALKGQDEVGPPD